MGTLREKLEARAKRIADEARTKPSVDQRRFNAVCDANKPWHYFAVPGLLFVAFNPPVTIAEARERYPQATPIESPP